MAASLRQFSITPPISADNQGNRVRRGGLRQKSTRKKNAAVTACAPALMDLASSHVRTQRRVGYRGDS